MLCLHYFTELNIKKTYSANNYIVTKTHIKVSDVLVVKRAIVCWHEWPNHCGNFLLAVSESYQIAVMEFVSGYK